MRSAWRVADPVSLPSAGASRAARCGVALGHCARPRAVRRSRRRPAADARLGQRAEQARRRDERVDRGDAADADPACRVRRAPSSGRSNAGALAQPLAEAPRPPGDRPPARRRRSRSRPGPARSRDRRPIRRRRGSGRRGRRRWSARPGREALETLPPAVPRRTTCAGRQGADAWARRRGDGSDGRELLRIHHGHLCIDQCRYLRLYSRKSNETDGLIDALQRMNCTIPPAALADQPARLRGGRPAAQLRRRRRRAARHAVGDQPPDQGPRRRARRRRSSSAARATCRSRPTARRCCARSSPGSTKLDASVQQIRRVAQPPARQRHHLRVVRLALAAAADRGVPARAPGHRHPRLGARRDRRPRRPRARPGAALLQPGAGAARAARTCSTRR